MLPEPDGSFDGNDRWQFLGLFDSDSDAGTVVLTTLAQRAAMMCMGIPGGVIIMPNPDGSIDDSDRLHLLGLLILSSTGATAFIGGGASAPGSLWILKREAGDE